ncbi:hypothetical protein AAFF_G00146690 [Aldrovandia affinis]|uniref:Uncharacterized protein n=1 Tax=Aldrovandia affinis TaxID=143900 RepID=A0AAD7RPJ3_9TELE|nr:hypothetical protein AAFF_G00146690 [Aldrovandia affinis]
MGVSSASLNLNEHRQNLRGESQAQRNAAWLKSRQRRKKGEWLGNAVPSVPAGKEGAIPALCGAELLKGLVPRPTSARRARAEAVLAYSE